MDNFSNWVILGLHEQNMINLNGVKPRKFRIYFNKVLNTAGKWEIFLQWLYTLKKLRIYF